jgi:hypothetical protein
MSDDDTPSERTSAGTFIVEVKTSEELFMTPSPLETAQAASTSLHFTCLASEFCS